MFCDEILELIEPMAAGELEADERITGHLTSCARCASALEAARRVDRLLRERPIARPELQFTSRTLARIRRDRWRREQLVDAGFNAAVVLATCAVLAAIWVMLHRAGLDAVGN